MDLSEEEVEEIFPSDRGESIEDADVESHMVIDRSSSSTTVIFGDDAWELSPHQESKVIDELDGNSIWELLIDSTVSKSILNRNT